MKFPRLALAAFLLAPILLQAAEPPVRDGLVLWLDAAAQREARQAAALPQIGNRQSVDLLLDRSPRARHAAQMIAERRPLFTADDEAAYLEFDGKDDFLALAGARQLAPAATIFVLAAPKTNAGRFSALLATAETGRNDYTSGLNLDLGSEKTAELSVVNIESAGASGARDLLTDDKFGAAERPFGDFHVFTVRSRIAKNGTELFLDGFKAGTRDRMESNIGLDQIVLGARLLSHDQGQPPFAQSFFHGAIAEVLVYDRVLNDAERQTVEQALLAKTVKLHALLRGAKGHALETVADAPPVQMLVPGFTVQELPVRVGNLNNVRYRHDGKVVGVGYDGRIHLLSDTDGDGLEDRAELFWDQKTMRGPIGVALTAKDDPRGDGVFVGSKGKVSFFVDANRDGRAEEEKIIATGWKEGFQGVDTVGLAIDPRDGSIYFGLGCANFADGYQIDKNTGRSTYDIGSHHGTIQRLSADFSTRETICTGVRFTCALAFNRHGDLFASEQEGATWLPNGNPFDELLHIQRGKHYGFPPRHPKHLPNVIDEPSVFDYGPQHQSTVGLIFNESVNGGPHFGPAQWEGDAILCGESRGKLYRTKLAKTPLGYIAENHLIACMGLLLVDACVTPQGDLLVACHSGPPDWGTGPAGEGRLFKIRYTGRDVPQPVAAWSAAPDEFRVAFDKPLDPADWATAQKLVKIEAGRFVGAGDRFETMRPGYQSVRDQMATPRRWVDVLGVSLSADRRTLALRVPRQTEPVSYAITLPLPEAWKQKGGLAQHPQIDVLASLNGVAAEAGDLRCVLPHPSIAVAKAFTAGSAGHAAFFATAAMPGVKLTLRGGVDPANPFVPSVQPGAKLDWDASKDEFASALFTVRAGDADAAFEAGALGRIKPLAPITTTASTDFALARGDLRTALAPHRVFVPWAADRPADKAKGDIVRTDVKGNWLAGRRLFFGEAACFSCHTVRGEGVAFGPDLTNLIHRDRDSVLHDILAPSATINPDQSGSTVKLKDGTAIDGIVRIAAGPVITLALAGGAEMKIEREKIAAIEPMRASLMLGDYAQRLSKTQQEDLLTFLLVDPLQPAPITRIDPAPPPARTRAELAAMLPLPQPRADRKPLRILLCAGEKDHGIGEHDYPLWLARWSKLLPLAEGVTVTTCPTGFPSDTQLAAADVAVLYSANAGWSPEVAPRLDAFQQRGGGLVYLHWAVGAQGHPEPLAERIGFAAQIIAFRHGPTELTFTDPAHSITRGFTQLSLLDETYWKMRANPRAAILASAIEDGAPQPQLWTYERGAGRVFGCIPGHYTWTHDDPLYRLLVLRGIAWAAGSDDIDRLSELAPIGARLAP